MRTVISLACISLLSLLSACATPDAGYYDANGNWIANNPNNANHSHAPLPGGTHDYRDDNSSAYTYDRRGYYDYNGYYIDQNGGLSVPQDMFPPRGMCRVWFTQRDLVNQPPVESCNDIRSRVPAGAYVIYGG